MPLFRDQIEQLRDLDLPAADADELEQLWDDLDAATDELEQQLRTIPRPRSPRTSIRSPT